MAGLDLVKDPYFDLGVGTSVQTPTALILLLGFPRL
jgi:hypothetical protein